MLIETIDNNAVNIFLIIIIIILCIFLYNLYIDNKSLRSEKKVIHVDCPKPVCPDQSDKNKYITAKDIVNLIFPGRGMDLANGTFASLDDLKNFDDTINSGLNKLNRPVNTYDSDYVVNKQLLEQDKIKKKIREIVDSDNNFPNTTTMNPNTTTMNPTNTTKVKY